MPRQCNIMFVTPSSLTFGIVVYCSLTDLSQPMEVGTEIEVVRQLRSIVVKHDTEAELMLCECYAAGKLGGITPQQAFCLHQGGVPVILSCQLPPHATWTSWAWRVHEVMLLTICVVCVALSWEFCFRHKIIMLLISYFICVVLCVELLFLCEVTLLITFCLCCALFQAPFHVWDKS